MNWKAYFFFTKGERRGVIALLIVASLFLLIRVLLANKLEDSSVEYAEESSISSINISENASASINGNAEGRNFDASKKTFKRSDRASRKHEKTDEIVEINSADTTTFKKLRGIGSGYARMIVNYREKLGGFYSKEQLLEVYKFPVETYEKIKNQLSVDTTLIRKINVNTATVKELKQHPYISYYQALSIVENRDLAPEMRYNCLYDMVVDEDLKEEDILRVAPYLMFE
jgi:competence ComEA-like helix-hairpin-helix protein